MSDDDMPARGKQLAHSGKYNPKTAEPQDEDGNSVMPLHSSETVHGGGQCDGAEVLNRIVAWYGRFIRVTDPDDLYLLTLWTAHTHLVVELYTTPRLVIDSVTFGSGKTTVLDHLNRLCLNPVQAASLSSPALIPRLLESKMRTLLLDEVDRSLRADKPGVEDLIGIINSGYRRGATRPVLVPVKGGGWETKEMSTFAPVSMAGNAPNLPDDTVSRQLRILLMPDLDGTVEDSDWEMIEDDAEELRSQMAEWSDTVRTRVKGMTVELHPRCIGRSKEKWRPLKRVAVAAGGEWPGIADRLIEKDLEHDAAEREAGLKAQPPGMVMLKDLFAIWPDGETFIPTRELVSKLIVHNPDYWGADSAYGRSLTEHRLGRLVTQAAKVTSSRPGGRGPRGYLRSHLDPVWHRLGIGRIQTGASGGSGATGADDAAFAGLTGCTASKATPTEPVQHSRLCGCGAELADDNPTDTCRECQREQRQQPDAEPRDAQADGVG